MKLQIDAIISKSKVSLKHDKNILQTANLRI